MVPVQRFQQTGKGVGMARVVAGMTMSLDGFINDRNGDVSRLYPDMDALRETDTVQEAMGRTGPW